MDSKYDMNGQNTFHITLLPESAHRLTDIAGKAGVQPEEFLSASVEEWLSRPCASLAEAAAYILNKPT
jgi:hypothetical protein